MKVYFAEFISPMYPEDNEIFQPGYTSEEKAKERIRDEIVWARTINPNCPGMYKNQVWCYKVLELEVEAEALDSLRAFH